MNRFIPAALAAAALAALPALPAAADALTRDRVHADSFGNLVIHSAAGYKRIIVGKGYAAEAYQRTGSYYEPEAGYEADKPEVVYLDRQNAERRCWRPPYRWHGRSYMYGLPDHVVPQAPLVCE